MNLTDTFWGVAFGVSLVLFYLHCHIIYCVQGFIPSCK